MLCFRRQAHLCILASSCDEPMYIKLIQALCNEHRIPLITVDNGKKLGEWAGLCKIDKDAKARKVVGCCWVVVKVSHTTTRSIAMQGAKESCSKSVKKCIFFKVTCVLF